MTTFRLLLVLLFAIISGFASSAAFAHFNLNQNVRIFHIDQGNGHIDLYLRLPTPYLLADKLGAISENGLPSPAPYTKNELEDGVLVHYLDLDALQRDPEGLAAIAVETLVLKAANTELNAEIVGLHVSDIANEPGFATLEEVLNVFADEAVVPRDIGEVYVGDTVTDIHLRYQVTDSQARLEIASLLDPGLQGQDDTANLVLDHRNGHTKTFRATGLLSDPIAIVTSQAAASWTFVIEGVRHILEGIDHLLFVFCLVIGAPTIELLLTRVTGFTIGHTVTLILGFFGVAPTATWFIPAVETAIAVSIIYAAVAALFWNDSHLNRNTVLVTVGIGLLHGFGFAFMLREILSFDAHNVWPSLLAFNLGVELGQVAIVALIWPLVLYSRALPPKVWLGARGAAAASISVVALLWTFERIAMIA